MLIRIVVRLRTRIKDIDAMRLFLSFVNVILCAAWFCARRAEGPAPDKVKRTKIYLAAKIIISSFLQNQN
jgi:hypothetical protein